jgi:SRSO17 transposase
MAAGPKRATKYWLSTLAAGTALARLVKTAKLRWRIERDYQELKQELGLVDRVRSARGPLHCGRGDAGPCRV